MSNTTANDAIANLWLTTWTDYRVAEQNENPLIEISRLNLFVGRNNSGKSRFVRAIVPAKLNQHNYIKRGELKKFEELKNELKNIVQNLFKPRGGEIGGISERDIETMLTQFKNPIFNQHSRSILATLTEHIKKILEQQYGVRHTVDETVFKALFADQRLSTLFDSFERHDPPHSTNIYLPIVRSMRPLKTSDEKLDSKNPITERTQKDYFGESKKGFLIISGEDLYNTLKEHLLGLPDQRKKIADYEALLSKYFFEEEKITLIPRHDQDVVNIQIGTGTQREIYNVGDGLQQIIIISSAAYLANQTSLFVIEEPENSLHPGMLRQLMQFLLKETQHQYFVTTHSNHLLEFAEEHENETRLFKLTQNPEGEEKKFTIHPTQKDRSILHDLGIKSSSVYLANCTIWVEGTSERSYLREFLKKYLEELPTDEARKHYIENYHYSFVEYQGSCLVHWLFDEGQSNQHEQMLADMTTPNIFLLADGDIKTKKAGARVETLENALGDRFYLLPCKEIENLIPEEIAKLAAKDIFSRKEITYEKSADCIDRLDYAEYSASDQGLGHHLDKCFDLGKEQAIFAESSGTIKGKTNFCQIAVGIMQNKTWESTAPIKTLCEKIMQHIKTHNK